MGAEAGDQAARCGGDRRHRGRAFAEVRRGDKPPREVVDVERPTEDARAHTRCRGHAPPVNLELKGEVKV